ncbi:unnamed protein product [Paramecium pentaurelia]|uniref:WD40-repeat-containing domain n=1 Tax=Paramecium pentaurelia TaxID=43138 RepID=A0A8S1WIQ2_9CILI|nr:unnamed protein product [Paramecium pentaurelia]
MFKPKMIENEKSLQCSYKHNLPIVQVVLNPLLEKEQRLLCNECLDNVDIEGKAVGFKKIIQMIEEQQKLRIDQVENIIIINIKQIELIQNQIDQLKQNIIQQLDQLKFIVHNWINNLQSIGLRYQTYSFHEELENIINNRNNLKMNENLLIKDIYEEYNNWYSKLALKLELFNEFPEYKYNNCKEILLNHQLMIQKFDLISNKKDEQQILLSEDNIILKQTDFSVKQNEHCISIAFNSSDSIMVSTNESIINVWKFYNGKLELLQRLKQHTDWVNALVFSKKQNSFISCSSDNTIRIWKVQGANDWISSFLYEKHTDRVYCMTVNQNEDQLFSGSLDKTIIVWKLDFKQNQLIYQYSLEKHDQKIQSLSLNQSERQLVSCAGQIIIWERGLNNKMEFKYFVNLPDNIYGQNIQFIKENQFVLYPGSKQVDEIFIFEQEEGEYQENQEKKIQINQNKNIQNMYLFPIVYNKQSNLMIVRHKACIYFIRELNNGKFKIVEQLNLNTNSIYGAVTNNSQHLVFWDNYKGEYSIYELQYK